jgi:hypothetical protein
MQIYASLSETYRRMGGISSIRCIYANIRFLLTGTAIAKGQFNFGFLRRPATTQTIFARLEKHSDCQQIKADTALHIKSQETSANTGKFGESNPGPLPDVFIKLRPSAWGLTFTHTFKYRGSLTNSVKEVSRESRIEYVINQLQASVRFGTTRTCRMSDCPSSTDGVTVCDKIGTIKISNRCGAFRQPVCSKRATRNVSFCCGIR